VLKCFDTDIRITVQKVSVDFVYTILLLFTQNFFLTRFHFKICYLGSIDYPRLVSQLGPEKRYGAGFIRKFQPKTCFLGWTKLHTGTLLPPIVPFCPFRQENR
jgi:hypothetical protein